MAAESARDRMAYMIWCIKNDKVDLLKTGDNHFLQPIDELDLDRAWEQHVCYLAADTMLEMLRYDITKLIHGGEYTLMNSFDPWVEGVQDALKVLGWTTPKEE